MSRPERKPEPKPCKRFKRMVWSAAFEKHLPTCEVCKAVIASLSHESENQRVRAPASELRVPNRTPLQYRGDERGGKEIRPAPDTTGRRARG